MEKPAPFDLNKAIASWHGHLARSSSIPRENGPELEAHLRDSVVRLQAAGLSEEEAWIIAQKRIGSSDALGQEFAKVNSPLRARGITEFQFIGALLALFGLASVVLYFGDSLVNAGIDPGDAFQPAVRWEPEFMSTFGFAPPTLHECMIACLAVTIFLIGIILSVIFRDRQRTLQHHGKPGPV